jgi:hypothetical protein
MNWPFCQDETALQNDELFETVAGKIYQTYQLFKTVAVKIY